MSKSIAKLSKTEQTARYDATTLATVIAIAMAKALHRTHKSTEQERASERAGERTRIAKYTMNSIENSTKDCVYV